MVDTHWPERAGATAGNALRCAALHYTTLHGVALRCVLQLTTCGAALLVLVMMLNAMTNRRGFDGERLVDGLTGPSFHRASHCAVPSQRSNIPCVVHQTQASCVCRSTARASPCLASSPIVCVPRPPDAHPLADHKVPAACKTTELPYISTVSLGDPFSGMWHPPVVDMVSRDLICSHVSVYNGAIPDCTRSGHHAVVLRRPRYTLHRHVIGF